MNDSVRAKLKIYSYSIIVLSVIVIILRILCLKFAFDTDVRYFSENSPLPIISNAILCLSLIWAASLLIFIPRGTVSIPAPMHSASAQFAAALCGFVFLFIGISSTMTYLQDGIILFSRSNAVRRDLILYLLSCFSSFLAAAYFFTALSSQHRCAGWRVILGFFPILWSLLLLARSYFDFYVAMNDPNKVAMQLALMAGMLFLLQELRLLLGRPQPRLTLFFTFASLLLTGVGGVAISVAPIADYPLSNNYYIDILAIAVLWLYILIRHLDLLSSLSRPAPQNTDESERTA